MKRFSVAVRPYVFEDLQRAAQALIDLLAERFGADVDAYGTAVEPLQTLLALPGSASLDQAFVQDLGRTIDAYGPVLRPRGGDATVQRLLRIARALLEWPEKIGGTVLWSPHLHLGEVASDPDLRVRISHPRTTCYTLPIKRSEDAFWISSEAYWQSFRSNRPTNLLYLDAPELRSCEAIEFVYGQQRLRARYRRLRPTETPLGFPDTPYHREGGFSGAFFIEAGVPQADASPPGTTREVYLTAQSDERVFASYPTVGWLNPLLLTFDVDADDVPAVADASPDRARRALALFTHPDLLLACEPHVEARASRRIDALRELAQRQRDEERPPSAVERLLWGGDGPEPWRPFFLLDQLGGEFVLASNVLGGTPSAMPAAVRQRVRLGWLAPADMPRNAAWLKDQVLSDCTYIEELDDDVRPALVLPPTVVPGAGSPHGYRRLRIDEDSERPPIAAILEAWFARRSAAGPEAVLDTMLLFAARYLERLRVREGGLEALESSAAPPYLGEGSYLRVEGATMLFNEVAFLDGFGQAYLSPTSSAYAVLPRIEASSASVDLVRSVPYGHEAFFRRLMAAPRRTDGFVADGRSHQQDQASEIGYRYGWWQEWFDALFGLPWPTEVRFVAEREGFILRRSRLARARLGKVRVGMRFDVEHMRV